MEKRKKALVVCSSRPATGNSLKLAKAVKDALGDDAVLSEPSEAPDPSRFAFIILCFGIYHGWPDGAMRAFMRKCQGNDVGTIITLGAYADSEHAFVCQGRAEGLMDSCRVKAKYICQGRIDPALVGRMKAKPADSPHSWDSERAKRVETAELHPDEADLAKVAEIFKNAWQKILEKDERPVSGKKKALLLAAFGTRSESAQKAYRNIEELARQARPNSELRWAFSSGMVRAKLRRKGVDAMSVSRALETLKLEGYETIEIIPLYMTPGEEHHKLLREVAAFRNCALGFDEIKIGETLLSSERNLSKLCAVVIANARAERSPLDALVFMGHGNADGHSDLLYMAAAAKLSELEKLAFLACVEGAPSFSKVQARLKELGVKKAHLIPFMIVAGDHAINDMAGDEPDSWKSLLEAEGIECHCELKGLGEYDDVVRMFLEAPRK